MIVLEYNTEQEALDAIQIINENNGYPIYNENNELLADNWDIPLLTINNTWVFLKPDDEYLINVPNIKIIEIDDSYYYYEPEIN